VKAFLTLLLACFGMGVAAAQAKPVELYKYENEDGIPVISNTIPPNLVHKGYSVITEDGTVIRTVARELTPAEQAERDRKLAEQKAAEEAGAARKRHDEELVKLYASPRDVEDARDRKILSIDTAIATTKANLEGLRLKKQHFEEQAADREREGQAPSAEILENLKTLEIQIADKERDIEARTLEKQHVSEQFALDLARITLLYSNAPVKTSAKTNPVN
jgi:hypothetical protein